MTLSVTGWEDWLRRRRRRIKLSFYDSSGCSLQHIKIRQWGASYFV